MLGIPKNKKGRIMKMRRSLKIAGFIIAMALLVCGVIGIGASAAEATLEIDAANVAYNDMMHLAFTLVNTDTLPDGAEAGIIIWEDAQDEYTVANSSYKSFENNLDGSTVYYKSYGIAAPEIGAEIYVAACYSLNGAVTVTETPFAYSIVDYLVGRLGENVTDVQAELYANVLTYGAASDAVLSEDSFVLVKAAGGYVGTYNRAVGAAKEVGSSFVLRAPITNEDGEYFAKWVDEAGETVSTDRVCTVAPSAVGLSLYTAVYGGENSYAFGFGFDDLTTGEVDVGTPDLAAAPTIECYGGYSGTNMRRWAVSYKGIAGATINLYMLPEATKNDTTDNTQLYTFTQDENGNYIIGAKDTLLVTGKANGDKELSIERGQKGSGYDSVFSNSVSGCKTAEIDFGFADITDDGVQNHINLYVYDGSVGSTYRFNLVTNSGGTGFVYGEQTTQGARDENHVKANGETTYYSVKPGEKSTLSITLNTSGDAPCFDFYYNGVYAGSLACSILKNYNANMDFSNAKISSLSVNTVTAAVDTFIFDNICFK